MNVATDNGTVSNQQGAQAHGHIIGRDNITVQAKQGMIEKLLLRLKEQYDGDEKTRTTIDDLARYHVRRAPDGVSGLKAKLEAGGRSHYYEEAIEKKEMFSKLLETWSLYSSAQLIFVHILAKAETEFTHVIYSQIPQKTLEEINCLVIERIVNPIVEECSSDLISVNHNLVHGMIYWLAEQCFIKWHHSVVAS